MFFLEWEERGGREDGDKECLTVKPKPHCFSQLGPGNAHRPTWGVARGLGLGGALRPCGRDAAGGGGTGFCPQGNLAISWPLQFTSPTLGPQHTPQSRAAPWHCGQKAGVRLSTPQL